jgi:hypothetical protein
MLLDKQTMFSDAQAITTSTASAEHFEPAMGNLKEIAFGTPIPMAVQVIEDFKGCTSVKVAIQTAVTEDFANPVVLAETAAIPVADLVAGYRFPLNFVPEGNKGFLRLYYTVAGTATAGKIDAGIVASVGKSFHDIK